MKSEKGTLVISIDFESELGYADEKLSESQKKLVVNESEISKKILELFEKYDTPATWAIVGHLLEDDCGTRDGRVHADFPEHIYNDSEVDWFENHPSAEDITNPLWFDSAGIIDRVKNSSVAHEIGSHSYAHILYGAPNIKKKAIEADISGLKRIHQKHNLEMFSFIFPRNMEGYHKELKEAGFICFRGESKFWYMSLPGFLRRLARLVDYYLPSAKTVLPSKHKSGLINIPDSLLLLGRNGLRKLVLPSVMKRKIRSGLNQAVKRKEIFHFWFHPSNLSYETETQLEILDYALRYASGLRDKGWLEVSTMKQVADKD